MGLIWNTASQVNWLGLNNEFSMTKVPANGPYTFFNLFLGGVVWPRCTNPWCHWYLMLFLTEMELIFFQNKMECQWQQGVRTLMQLYYNSCTQVGPICSPSGHWQRQVTFFLKSTTFSRFPTRIRRMVCLAELPKYPESHQWKVLMKTLISVDFN